MATDFVWHLFKSIDKDAFNKEMNVLRKDETVLLSALFFGALYMRDVVKWAVSITFTRT
jgi:hypothetical protein